MMLTDRTLGDLVFALRTSLGRVREDELTSPVARAQWNDVQRWLGEAEAFRRADQDANQTDFVRLKSFPLSGAQLRTLQVEVELADARRAAQLASRVASVARRRSIPQSPHETIQRARATSFLLAAVLILSLFNNVTWFALTRLGIITVPHLTQILAINSLVSFLSLGLWALHHWHLVGHLRAVHWHIPVHLGSPLHLHVR